MDLLEFSRGPALQISLAIFVFGVSWRLVGLFLLPLREDHSAPRKGAAPAWMSVLLANVRKQWPHKTFMRASVFQFVNGYVFHVDGDRGVPVCAAHSLHQELVRRELARPAVEPRLRGWRDHGVFHRRCAPDDEPCVAARLPPTTI